MIIRTFIFISIILLLSCHKNHNLVEVSHHLEIDEDIEYYEVFKKNSRMIEVYEDFETKFIINATFLSPKFQEKFNSRLKSLRRDSAFNLGKTGSLTGFLVSIFSPIKAQAYLEKSSLWGIDLEIDGKKYHPISITRMQEKNQLNSFFDYVDIWTNDYIIVFDVPVRTPEVSEMVKENKMVLFLNNESALIKMSW